ncbi:hypothetical protein M427DRAFT_130623 [Gonapodya prolifera JEL478]|uniref:Xylanolytic transcriptional activator regulatory domain-containing protein n=1 Tax=Gonapodya prolifera (strain JEL478) TaxID=1344416 RepID=A0A139AYZ4_GONPJ|nr:hypothetical protein M427DRAFT_130623 [Gonapodya prolifera JEL478]|eukprot:KXS21946.1 hypothetical protein M427DRAFT_130623 [Gonapodya prolifera JEL478]
MASFGQTGQLRHLDSVSSLAPGLPLGSLNTLSQIAPGASLSQLSTLAPSFAIPPQLSLSDMDALGPPGPFLTAPYATAASRPPPIRPRNGMQPGFTIPVPAPVYPTFPSGPPTHAPAPHTSAPGPPSPARSPGAFSVSEFFDWPDSTSQPDAAGADSDVPASSSSLTPLLRTRSPSPLSTPFGGFTPFGSPPFYNHAGSTPISRPVDPLGGPPVPDVALLNQLTGLHFEMFHVNAPFLHRPSFLTNPSKDPLLLHSLWAANMRLYAAKYLADPRSVVDAAEGIFERAMKMVVGRLHLPATLSTLTAILFLVAVARHMGPAHLAQRLVGLALVMGRELGLGKDGTGTGAGGEVGREMRRRLLWHLFMMERSYLPLAPTLLTDAEAKRQYLPMADEVFYNLDPEDDEANPGVPSTSAAGAPTRYGEVGFADLSAVGRSVAGGASRRRLAIDQRPAAEIFEATSLVLNGRMGGRHVEKRMMQRLVERWWEQGSGFTIAPLILVNFRGHIAKIRRYAEEFDMEMWTRVSTVASDGDVEVAPGERSGNTTATAPPTTEIAQRVANFNAALREYADSLPLPLKMVNAASDVKEITKILRMLLGTGGGTSPVSPDTPPMFLDPVQDLTSAACDPGAGANGGAKDQGTPKPVRRSSVRGFGSGVVDKATLALLEFHSLRLLLNLPRSVSAMFEDKAWQGSENFSVCEEAVKQMSLIVEALARLDEWQPTMAYIFEEQTAFDESIDVSVESNDLGMATTEPSSRNTSPHSDQGFSSNASMPTVHWASGVLPSLVDISVTQNTRHEGDGTSIGSAGHGAMSRIKSEGGERSFSASSGARDGVGRPSLWGTFGLSPAMPNPAKQKVNGMIASMKKTKRRFMEAVASKSDVGKLWSIKFWVL